MSSKLPARREKQHSAKPYDRPKSFLQRVTKSVANYLPTWLNPTSWVVSGSNLDDKEPSEEPGVADEETGGETEEECEVVLSGASHPTAQKANSHRAPATVTSPGSVTFTRKPLERTSPSSQQTIVANGDDHSDNSETSASTSGCSSLAPSQDRKRVATSDSRTGCHLKGLQVSKHHLENIQQQLNKTPLFTIPAQESVKRSSPVPTSSRKTESLSVGTLVAQKTRERSQKRVSVENYHPVEYTEKDVESSSTRTSLWSEDEKNSESSKRPRTARPQAVAPNKRPCFSVSAFGSPLRLLGRQNTEGSSSPVLQERIRPRSQNSTSPFCEGSSLYGGGMSYKKARISTPYNSVLHAEAVKVRHTGSREVLSSAAQKVLNVLENMSTPLMDAKKIPVENVTRDFALSYTPSIYARKPLRQEDSRLPVSSVGPPRTSFPLPTPSSQQPTPLLALLNQSASSRNVDLGNRISRTESGGAGNHSVGAIRARVGPSTRSSKHQKLLEEPLAQTDLPRVPLVREDALPAVSNISFSFPVGTSTPIMEANPAAIAKKKSESSTPALEGRAPTAKKFTFSSPIENMPPESVSDNAPNIKEDSFQFRSPVFKTAAPSETERNVPVSCQAAKSPKVNFNFAASGGSVSTSPLRRKKPTDQDTEEAPAVGGLKPASELLVGGSVMDILGKPSAIGAKDDKPVSQEKSGFGSAFQKKSTEWECSECLVRNKDSDKSCVACTTPRPSLKSTGEGFGNRFAPPTTSWCCPTCMINNTDTDVRCVACCEPKPGSVASTAAPLAPAATASGFKMPSSPSKSFASIPLKASGRWECDTCLVRNDEGHSKCIACETQRPAATTTAGVKEAFTGFKFGQQPKDTTTTTSASPFKFGLTDKQSTKSSSSPAFAKTSTTASEDASSQKTSSFKFGVTVSSDGTKTSEGFKFGVTNSSDGTKPSEGFKFGAPSASDASKQPEGFKFGVTSTSDSSKLPEGFKFGASDSDSAKQSEGFKFGLPVDKSNGAATGTATEPGFKFGLSTNTSLFKFGAPNEPSEKGNAKTENESETSEIACDTVSSSTAASKVQRENECKESKPADSVSFVFGGQAVSNDKKTETTPVLTFGQKPSDVSKQSQETFSFEKPRVAKQADAAITAANNKSDVNVVDSPFGSSALKPSLTVAQFSSAPPVVSESVGPKPELGGFKFSTGVQSQLKPVTSNTTDNAAEKTSAPLFKFGGQTTTDGGNKKLPAVVELPVGTGAPSGLQFTFKGKEPEMGQGTAVTSSSIFGATQGANVASATLPSFTMATSNASTPSFGVVSQPLAASSAGAACLSTGSTSTAAAPAAGSAVGGFVFGTSKPAGQAPATNPAGFKFTFGNDNSATKVVSFFGSTGSSSSASSVPPSAAPFSFGKPSLAPAPNTMLQQPQQQPPPQQQQPLFTFGSASGSANTSNSGATAFGGSQAPGPVFGFTGAPGTSTSVPPAFGQQPGVNTAASTEPFRFGPTGTMTTPTAGVFQMEAPKPALPAPNNAAAAGLFKFGAPQAENVSNPLPVFGATQSQPVAGAGFTFGSPAVPPMGSTFAPADSSTGATAPFVFGSAVANSGATPAQPTPSGSPFSFQPTSAASNPFNVTNSTRVVRKATRRLGANKKK